jgi:hypothetical protein
MLLMLARLGTLGHIVSENSKTKLSAGSRHPSFPESGFRQDSLKFALEDASHENYPKNKPPLTCTVTLDYGSIDEFVSIHTIWGEPLMVFAQETGPAFS